MSEKPAIGNGLLLVVIVAFGILCLIKMDVAANRIINELKQPCTTESVK